jgi:ketohexokinase
MARILSVGVATLDVVLSVNGYPGEDTEVRARDMEVRRGGNAANTAVALSLLGHDVSWAGVTTAGSDGGRILHDLAGMGVKTNAARVLADGTAPTSYILLNRENGSRTIIHHRNLPEYGYAEFARINLRRFDWLHFEGRNVPETARMLRRARDLVPGVPRSVEIEKPRDGIHQLYELADVLMVSRHYARAVGYADAPAVLQGLGQDAPRALIVCGWGTDGAWARSYRGEEHHSPAHVPPQVVDTVGAGDVLNAGIIHGLVQRRPIEEVLPAATRLAGESCARAGIDGAALTRPVFADSPEPAQH